MLKTFVTGRSRESAEIPIRTKADEDRNQHGTTFPRSAG